jgi:hypothetical protein
MLAMAVRYGAVASNPDGSKYACSSGATVFYGSAPNRQYGMLTAAHCSQSFFYTRAGAFVGRTHKINTKADVQMLRTGSSGQSYSNRIFNGAWNPNYILAAYMASGT